MLEISNGKSQHMKTMRDNFVEDPVPESKKYKPNYQPRLDTIKMVEEFIISHSGEYKRRALWEQLPKRKNYKKIIDYLLESGKIVLDRDGIVVWIWDPEIMRQYYHRDDLSI
ncbi:MAG: hypothetical protein A4E28_00059 [Methanocella sp. PtaU1.Bin125]|nr:MAG: hypothetical protein A4E28_00059 [Methanocella sp. PtaU1.Bin125]